MSCSRTGGSASSTSPSVAVVLAAIDDDEVFPTVMVGRVARTLSWPASVDLDADVLHGDEGSAAGVGPKPVRE